MEVLVCVLRALSVCRVCVSLYPYKYIVITSNIFLCVYKPPENGHGSGPKHVV
jgi:hypothetical protein